MKVRARRGTVALPDRTCLILAQLAWTRYEEIMDRRSFVKSSAASAAMLAVGDALAVEEIAQQRSPDFSVAIDGKPLFVRSA